jgi:hypothetical protein
MYLIWILTLVSNSKLLKRNSKSFSIFQVAQNGFGPISLEAWSIFPPSPAQLRPAHAAIWPNRPTRPFLHPLYWSRAPPPTGRRHRASPAHTPAPYCTKEQCATQCLLRFPFSKLVSCSSVSPSWFVTEAIEWLHHRRWPPLSSVPSPPRTLTL